MGVYTEFMCRLPCASTQLVTKIKKTYKCNKKREENYWIFSSLTCLKLKKLKEVIASLEVEADTIKRPNGFNF